MKEQGGDEDGVRKSRWRDETRFLFDEGRVLRGVREEERKELGEVEITLSEMGKISDGGSPLQQCMQLFSDFLSIVLALLAHQPLPFTELYFFSSASIYQLLIASSSIS